jgi:hypothetical protein
MSENVDLPVSVKEKLLELSKRLPDSTQGQFLTRAAKRLGDVALDHPNTIVFSLAGLLLGEIVDNLLSVPIPLTEIVLDLAGDHAGELGGLAGFIYGFLQDKKNHAVREQIAGIVRVELQNALST